MHPEKLNWVPARTRPGRARIRISHEGSRELLEALAAHVDALLASRSAALDIPAARSAYNARIKDTRRVIDEAERTAREEDWLQDRATDGSPDNQIQT